MRRRSKWYWFWRSHVELVVIVLIICECCHNIQVDGLVLWEELKIKGPLLIVYLFNNISDKCEKTTTNVSRRSFVIGPN